MSRLSQIVTTDVSFDGYPTRVCVAGWSPEGQQMRELERPDSVSVWGSCLRWGPGSRDLRFIGDEQVRSRLRSFTEVRSSLDSGSFESGELKPAFTRTRPASSARRRSTGVEHLQR